MTRSRWNGGILKKMLTSTTRRKDKIDDSSHRFARLRALGDEFQEAIVDAKMELETIFDLIPAVVCYKDANNNFVRVNRYTADLFGTTPEKMANTHNEEWTTKEEAAKYWEDDKRILRNRKAELDIIDTVVDANGEERVFRTSKYPVMNGDEYILAFCVDITEDVKTRRLLEKACKDCVRHRAKVEEFLVSKGIDPKEMPEK